MTLIFNKVRAVVKVHVGAKFHQDECSGLWVIVLNRKKTPTQTIQSAATARTVKTISQRATLTFGWRALAFVGRGNATLGSICSNSEHKHLVQILLHASSV